VGLHQQRGSASHLAVVLATQPRAAGALRRRHRNLDQFPDWPVLPTCCAVKAPPASAERPRPPIQVRRSRAIVHEAATFRAGPAHRRGRSCAFGKTTSSASWTLLEPGSWPPVFRLSCREGHTNQQSERGFRYCPWSVACPKASPPGHGLETERRSGSPAAAAGNLRVGADTDQSQVVPALTTMTAPTTAARPGVRKVRHDLVHRCGRLVDEELCE